MTITTELLGWAVAAVALGATFMLRAKHEIPSRDEWERAEQQRDKRCEECRAQIELMVTKESLEQQLAPIHEELAHRKKSMDTLGRSVARLLDQLHRVELGVVAIASHVGAELPRALGNGSGGLPDSDDSGS